MAEAFRAKQWADFKHALVGKPLTQIRPIAVRIALRVLPIMGSAARPSESEMLLLAFRANFIAWAAARYSAHDMSSAAAAASIAAAAVARESDSSVSHFIAAADIGVMAAARSVASAASAVSVFTDVSAASAAALSADAAIAATYAVAYADGSKPGAAVIWDAMSHDMEWLMASNPRHAGKRVRDLIGQPLWMDELPGASRDLPDVPEYAREHWDRLVKSPTVEKYGFSPWIEWYGALLPHHSHGSAGDYFGRALTIRIAAQSDEWWKRGAAAVNADIARWLDEKPTIPARPHGAADMAIPPSSRIFVRLPHTLARDFNPGALKAPSAETFQRMLTLGPDADVSALLPKGLAAASPVGRMLTGDSLLVEDPAAAGLLREKGAVLYQDVQFKIFSDAAALPDDQRNWYWDAGTVLQPTAPVQDSLTDVLRHINAPAAWDLSEGDGATIAVIDTGIAPNLPEIGDNRRSRFNPDSLHEDRHWVDKVGHGSMCAVIAAGGGNGARFGGVAPLANVVSCRTDFTAGDIALIYGALIDALDKGEIVGPLVVNNSYGLYTCQATGQMPADHPFMRLIERAVDMGIVVVFAAGNNHIDVCRHAPEADGPNTIWGPNSHDRVLSVGTVNRDNSNRASGTPHANSSRGPGEWADAYPKPDCVAPTYGTVVWGGQPRSMPWWGTSGAAPQVAGLAALIQSYGVSALGGTFQTSEVNDIIRESCRRLDAPRTCVGHGLIDCHAALESARSRRHRV